MTLSGPPRRMPGSGRGPSTEDRLAELTGNAEKTKDQLEEMKKEAENVKKEHQAKIDSN